MYHYKISNYIYQNYILDERIELYRYYLMDKLVKFLSQKIKKIVNIQYFKITKKISQYLSHMIMNILTDRTNQYKKQIILEDGLFLVPNDKHIYDFYRDINYFFKIEIKPDQYNIKKIINNFIKKINDKITDLNKLNKYEKKFIIIKNKLPIIPKFIIKKSARHYKNPDDPNNDLIITYLNCCNIRYCALMSGANQFMVDLNYKKQLRQLGFNFECFGSVFNRYFDHFCSMFYDLEKYFGSCGSFFALKIYKGKYMANPPYDDNLLTNMYLKIKKIFLHHRKNICFIISIPKWDDYPLETIIENDAIYQFKMIKHEKFHDPYTLKLVPIPPYISYIFCDSDINKIKKIFINFTNL